MHNLTLKNAYSNGGRSLSLKDWSCQVIMTPKSAHHFTYEPNLPFKTACRIKYFIVSKMHSTLQIISIRLKQKHIHWWSLLQILHNVSLKMILMLWYLYFSVQISRWRCLPGQKVTLRVQVPPTCKNCRRLGLQRYNPETDHTQTWENGATLRVKVLTMTINGGHL